MHLHDLALQKGRVLLCRADRRTQKRRIPLDPRRGGTRGSWLSKGALGDDIAVSRLDILAKAQVDIES